MEIPQAELAAPSRPGGPGSNRPGLPPQAPQQAGPATEHSQMGSVAKTDQTAAGKPRETDDHTTPSRGDPTEPEATTHYSRSEESLLGKMRSYADILNKRKLFYIVYAPR